MHTKSIRIHTKYTADITPRPDKQKQMYPTNTKVIDFTNVVEACGTVE